ncbi:hypothetical protein [Pseudonocardia sp. NPDC049635]|uniref:hypothetical protein n=1 Tax=Pseudonocardia sp. NPDC049635 TaxID=3155506 RepID=UPI0033F80874
MTSGPIRSRAGRRCRKARNAHFTLVAMDENRRPVPVPVPVTDEEGHHWNEAGIRRDQRRSAP